ncbi:MAG: TetR/AcrR family transcriptional regulator [Ideonella sp.]|jgi:TetR/AcrR family transcriptional regulator|nr:TetR/AcrR family transcriptional regulator [Ideonella sp.]
MARGRSPAYDGQREAILDRAADLFARQGYAGTSMNEVAQACGLSKPAVYHYFKDKYQLLLEIAEGHVSRLEATVASALQAHRDLPPEALLRVLIQRIVHAYAGAQNAHRVLTEDVRYLEPDDRRRVLDTERRIVGSFAELVGRLRPEAHAADLAKPLTMLLFGMVNWMFTWHRADGPLTHEALAPVVADLFTAGIAAVGLPAAAPPAANPAPRAATVPYPNPATLP